MAKALIAMSGGVDSAVSAYLMQQAGYDCFGCTMRLFENADANVSSEKSCCSLDDTEDAREIAHRLGMPHYVFNFTEEFRETVIGKFIRCYQCGKTPNPCIECNRYLKFEKLLERAAALGCDQLVTGHYAQVVETDSGYALRRGADPAKDQSYVLYMLTQAQLAHIRFPLGGMTKQETRRLAEQLGFVNAHKHDSQDICFVPDGDYARVIQAHTGETPIPGDFVDLQGNVIGRHQGIIHYTVGQRRGLGIAVGKPAYVCALDVPRNRVVRWVYDLYFTRILPRIGGAVSGDRAAYSYLPASVHNFPSPKEFCRMMEDAGFREVSVRTFTGGLCRLFVGKR